MCCECLAACSGHRESFFLCDETKQSDQDDALPETKIKEYLEWYRMVPELDGLKYHEQYSSPPSSSTTKSGRSLYFFETMFLGKIFQELIIFRHFGPNIISTKIKTKYNN